MFKLKKISLEQVHNLLEKYRAWILGFVFVILLSFALLIYYQHVYTAIKEEPQAGLAEEKMNQTKLEKVFSNLDNRQDNLERVLEKEYRDPFSF